MGMLVKFTTAYVAAEDRIRVAGECRDGSPVTLWLTQRLLGRLVPMVASWLEQDEAPTTDRAAVQQFRQDAARGSLRQHRPVPSRPEAASWLVTHIDHGTANGMMQLRFRAGPPPGVLLRLAPEPARQWLDMLLHACRTAGWPLDVWPAWILSAAPLHDAGAAH